MQTLINREILGRADSYSAALAKAQPFPHLVIDHFLDDAFARELLAHFPPFAAERAIGDNGRPGSKATRDDVKNLGSVYQKLDSVIASPEFLDWMSRATGIPNLLYDPDYFGGGTHENRNGQDMSLHVDFSNHPKTGWYRRLNALLYLNPEWEESWGGALELWQNPWQAPSKNSIAKIQPAWNRLVIFPTSDHSWHGFEAVKIPAAAQARVPSRRSFALYLYTKEKPTQTHSPHSTVYFERPMPETIKAGEILKPEDWNEVLRLTARRDDLLKTLYERETGFRATIDQLNERLREQEAALQRLNPDGKPMPNSNPAKPERTDQSAARPLILEPQGNHQYLICDGQWPQLSLRPGAKVEAENAKIPGAHDWALIRLRESSLLQLVYLARDFHGFFLALQPAQPQTLLVPRGALFAKVSRGLTPSGDAVALPALRPPLHGLALAWFFLSVHIAKNLIFRRVKSPFLWKLSQAYRRALKLLGIHVPVILPPTN